MPIPTDPRPDFVLVQSRQLFGLFEALFDGPAATGDPDQFSDGHSTPRVSEIVGHFGGIRERAANQPAPFEMLVFGVRPSRERPVALPFALGSRTAGEPLPSVCGKPCQMFRHPSAAPLKKQVCG